MKPGRLESVLNLVQQSINPPGRLFTIVVGKIYRGNKPEIELLADPGPNETAGAFKARRDFVLIHGTAEQIEKYSGVSQVFANFHAGQVKPLQAWIVNFTAQDFRYQFQEQISYPLCALMIHNWRSAVFPDLEHRAFRSAMKTFDLGFAELGRAECIDKIDDLAERCFNDRLARSYGGESQYRALPKIMIAALGHGDVELIAHPGLNAFQNAALALQ